MHWTCPHCGISLAIADDALGAGWAFSQCYKCAGFALIRRAEINVIKVDKAPPGEKVLLPEASKDPTVASMSQSATQKLMRHTSKPIPKVAPPVGLESPIGKIPDPLPEIQIKTTKSKALPTGIAIAGTLAIFSGIYLFIQGQAIWNSQKSTIVLPSSSQEKKTASHETSEPSKPAVVSAPALTTSITPSQETVAANEKVVTDKVQQSAMAPLKSELKIRVKIRKANLHSGPGMEYPVIIAVEQNDLFPVVDWSDRWFKLSVPHPTDKTQTKLAWIRNDLVEIDTSP